MRTPGIEVHDLWKKFHRGELHDSLRDLVPDMTKRLLGRAPRRDELAHGDFWALKGIEFEVTPGHALGVIGPNGAGKSTLLKVLTKVLRPTRGSCIIRGRIGALIEIAAGFHPDLTGRENVFLQGSIMGMPQVDIARKFDEIVAFSGIGDFIDTPVKRYSSGMNARLGFSIAAHLDPDVLIIDEVLAVGDMSFQQRAFGRLASMAKSGIPVVVVSHQLDRVASLCTDAILLGRGEVITAGTPAECIAVYMRGQLATAPDVAAQHPLKLEALQSSGRGQVRSGERVRFTVSGRADGFTRHEFQSLALRVRSVQSSQVLFSSSTDDWPVRLPEYGDFEVEFDLQLNVPRGIFSIEAHVWDRQLGKDALAGPSVVLEVTPGAPCWGMVQMNPTVRLLSPAAPHEPLEPAR